MAHTAQDADGAQSAEAWWVAACACGCKRAPLAGSSARLGVALPSAAPQLFLATATAPAPAPLARRVEILAVRIEHVPLPASV